MKLCLYIPPERKEYKTKFNLTTDEWERIKNPLLKDKELRTIKNDISEIENKARKALDSLIKPTFESFIEAYSNQVYIVGKDPFIGDWFDKYIEELKNDNRPFTYREHLKTSKNSFLGFNGKNARLDQSSPEQSDHLTLLIVKIILRSTKISRGWSRTSVFPTCTYLLEN